MLHRSRYQLTYQQAQDLLDGDSPMTGPRDMAVDPRDHAELRSRLQMLDKLTNKLRAARVQVSKYFKQIIAQSSALCRIVFRKVPRQF